MHIETLLILKYHTIKPILYTNTIHTNTIHTNTIHTNTIYHITELANELQCIKSYQRLKSQKV